VKADDLRPLLRAESVLGHFGVTFKRHGRELRTHQCPACGQRSRDAVCINAQTSVWHCKVCGVGGDAFDLIAGYGATSAFPATKALAMEIAGVSATDDVERTRRAFEREQAEALQRKQAEIEREAVRERLARTWDAFDRRSVGGERYLDTRAIPSVELRHVVRFTDRGCPALPLRELASGRIVGIQYRQTHAGADPKVLAVPGSQVAGSALWGRLSDIDPEGTDVCVITEGLADTLVAHVAFSGCAVLGAPGADQLEAIAAAVAPRVLAARGWLLVVPHDDPAGVTHAVRAVRAAQTAGLVLDRDLLLVDIGEFNDLADAWRAGWRWQWPSLRGDVG
jgi:phage/plasmid primase-like uncharacterized protein